MKINKYFRRIVMIILTLIVIVGLQYQYRFGENGYNHDVELKKQIDEQKQRNEQQLQANQALSAGVIDLKTGLEATEEHARVDLGLIKTDETFLQMSTATDNSKKKSKVIHNPNDAIEPIE